MATKPPVRLWIIVDNQYRFNRHERQLKTIARKIARQTERARRQGWVIMHVVADNDEPCTRMYTNPATFLALSQQYGMQQVARPGDIVTVKFGMSGFNSDRAPEARAYVTNLKPAVIAICGFYGSLCAFKSAVDVAELQPCARVRFMKNLVNSPPDNMTLSGYARMLPRFRAMASYRVLRRPAGSR